MESKSKKKTQVTTIICFVCGVLGILLSDMAIVATITGVVLGVISLSKFNPEIHKNKGLAIAGLVICIIYTLLTVFKIGARLV